MRAIAGSAYPGVTLDPVMSYTVGMSTHAPNSLAHASSAYLRSAMHQPTAVARVGRRRRLRWPRREDKPILLDIGAVWCHWCHVMDRESYESAEIAAILNEHFIAIKVDRDERPDVDARYQAAVAAITGQGGWPLTVFLTPDGKMFFGGTYFPPRGQLRTRQLPAGAAGDCGGLPRAARRSWRSRAKS